MLRFVSTSLAVVALSMFLGAAQAADKKADTSSHDGTFVSATAGKLVMTGKDKKEHSHDVSKDAKVTIDGKAGKLDDLKKGMAITVTTDKDGKVTTVASGKAKAAVPAKAAHPATTKAPAKAPATVTKTTATKAAK